MEGGVSGTLNIVEMMCDNERVNSVTKVTFFLGDPFLKFVFCNCDTTDFQTDRFTLLTTRMRNALCWPFLKFTSLAPLVAIFVIFGLCFMLLSLEEIDVLPMIELRSFAVFAYFRLQLLFYNLISKFLLRIRPLKDGTTSGDENFPDQERGRGSPRTRTMTFDGDGS